MLRGELGGVGGNYLAVVLTANRKERRVEWIVFALVAFFTAKNPTMRFLLEQGLRDGACVMRMRGDFGGDFGRDLQREFA